MANIRVNIGNAPYMGQPVSFRSPVGCADVTGLIVYYPTTDGTKSNVFTFTDAHGSNVGGSNLFAENVIVKVILDTDLNRAYIQNADTNAYLESRFANLGTKEHTHSASDITAGTFAGAVIANSGGQTPGSYLVRNQKLSKTEETPTVNGAICWLYE